MCVLWFAVAVFEGGCLFGVCVFCLLSLVRGWCFLLLVIVFVLHVFVHVCVPFVCVLLFVVVRCFLFVIVCVFRAVAFFCVRVVACCFFFVLCLLVCSVLFFFVWCLLLRAVFCV